MCLLARLCRRLDEARSRRDARPSGSTGEGRVMAAPAPDGRSFAELSRAALRAGQETWLIARAVSLRAF